MSSVQVRRAAHATPCQRLAHRPAIALLALLTMAACSGDSPSAPDNPGTPIDTPTPVLSSVSPDTLVEGVTITLRGSGFSATASANVVTIDGVTATVTAASAAELTVTVPAFDCRPQRTVDVQVSRGGKTSNAMTAPVRPTDFVDVSVGELLLVDDPSDLCLQFPPAASGAGEYLVGIGAAAERPDLLFDVTMTGLTGHAAPAGVTAAAASISGGLHARVADRATPALAFGREVRGPTTNAISVRSDLRGWDWHIRVEPRMQLMMQEALDGPRSDGIGLAGALADRARQSAGRIPAVGDQIEIRVPTFMATTLEGVCTPISITTEVRIVGERGIFVTDVGNPAAGALTDAEIQAFSDAFDSFVYDADTEYFGTPSDMDENERVLVVLTVEINKAAAGLIEDVAAVVFPFDLWDPSYCAASDGGELTYFSVPDPDSGLGKTDYVEAFVPVLAHEFAHVIQSSVRLKHGPENSAPLAPWEGEGQATLAMEIVGHSLLGLTPGQDYGAATVWSDAGGDWYGMPLDRLARYYGYDVGGGRRADAPETCSLFLSSLWSPSTDQPDSIGCHPSSAYGAAWSFFRYLADRYGPQWPGGEAGLMRDWIARNPTLQGAANLEALLGRPFVEVFAEWAAMHYIDAEVPGADPALLMSSWDLGDVMPALGPGATLEPESRTFADFTASFSVRGGGTAYNLFGEGEARPATALRFRNGSGGILGGDMRPTLWVVRTR